MRFDFGCAAQLYADHQHPRLFCGPDDLACLRAALRQDPARRIMPALRGKARAQAARVEAMAGAALVEFITARWFSQTDLLFWALPDMALAGVLDEDERLIKATVRLFTGLAEAQRRLGPGGRWLGDMMYGHTPMAYDLLYPHMTVEERERYVEWAMTGLLRGPSSASLPAFLRGAGANTPIMLMVMNLLHVLALDGDPEAPDLARDRDLLLRMLDASLHTALGPDGYPAEDIGYGTGMAANLAFAVEAARRAGLYDPYTACPRYALSGRAMLHFVQPWGGHLSNTGDQTDSAIFREFLLARLAKETGDPALAWLLGALAFPHWPVPYGQAWLDYWAQVTLDDGMRVPAGAFGLLMAADLPAPAHPARAGIPTAFRDRGRGIVSFRSGWEEDAAFVVFDGAHRSPAAQGHAHDSAGHFSLSALGEYFAIDTGRYNIEQNCHNVTLVNGQSGRSTGGEWRMSYYHGLLTDYQPGDFCDFAAADSSHQHDCCWARRSLGLVKGARPYLWTVDDINAGNAWAEYWWQLHTSPENDIALDDEHAVITGWRRGNLLDVHFALPAPREYPAPHTLALARDIALPSSIRYVGDVAERAARFARPADMVHYAVFLRPRLLAKVEGYNGRFMALMLPRRKDETPARMERIPAVDNSLAVKITFPEVEDILIFAYEHHLLEAEDIIGRGQWCVVRRDRATGDIVDYALGHGTRLAVANMILIQRLTEESPDED